MKLDTALVAFLFAATATACSSDGSGGDLGTPETGGGPSTGGAPESGGATGGSTGGISTGGQAATGGTFSSGGDQGSAGGATGGSPSGGSTASGGLSNSGGEASTGGTGAVGGGASSGGSLGSGGAVGSGGGGSSATGGTGGTADLDTWDNFAEAFFSDYCVACHNDDNSGDATRDYHTEAVVMAESLAIACGVAKSDDVRTELGCTSQDPVANQFPAGGGPKPTEEERDRLVAWIMAAN